MRLRGRAGQSQQPANDSILGQPGQPQAAQPQPGQAAGPATGAPVPQAGPATGAPVPQAGPATGAAVPQAGPATGAAVPQASPATGAAAPQASPAAPQAAPAAVPRQHVVRRTRAGGAWVGLALSAVVLLLLLVFILENEQSANIGYFGAHGHLPLGVALLLAAVAGALLVIIPGTARIIQLRRTARRHRAQDAAAVKASPQAAAAPGPAAGQPVDPV